MKILITLDFPPDEGGIQQYLYSIVQDNYTKNDIVLTPVPHKKRPGKRIHTRSRILRTGPSQSAGKGRMLVNITIALFRLRHVLKNTTWIECGNVYAAIPVWFTHTLHRKPYRVYTYGTELLPLRAPGIKNVLLRKALSKAEIVYTLGSYTESLLRAVGIRQPVWYRPPRIPVSTVTGHERMRRNKYEILSVGRLVAHKGHRDLLAALSLIAPSGPWSATIVGEGPERSRLERSSEHLHLTSKVSLTGEITDDEKILLYYRAGIFVLSSMETPEGTEGFGIVLLEAMAHRIPIVAYATGEIPDILGNGTCGLLVRPGDILGLSRAVESIPAHQRDARKRVHNAYERVKRVYSRGHPKPIN